MMDIGTVIFDVDNPQVGDVFEVVHVTAQGQIVLAKVQDEPEQPQTLSINVSDGLSAGERLGR